MMCVTLWPSMTCDWETPNRHWGMANLGGRTKESGKQPEARVAVHFQRQALALLWGRRRRRRNLKREREATTNESAGRRHEKHASATSGC